MRVIRTILASVVLSTAGCDDASKATQAAQDAADRTQKAVTDAGKRVDTAAKNASDVAGKAATDALDTAKTAVDDTKNATTRAWAGLTDTGELSKGAVAWIDETVESTDVRAAVAKGVQIAPVAYEIGRTINAAVDSDTAIEPIYQALDGRDPSEVDKAISAMPRVEVVDGVKVGFTQLNRLDSGASVDERAYLITWRREDHLLGMLYRTKRTIDLDMLVKEAPRLIALTQAAVASKTP